MAFGHLRETGSTPAAEINMVPLIDVMLVLLVIFMVAAPLMTHAVKLDLPQASSTAAAPSEKISLSVDAAGQWFWEGQACDAVTLQGKLRHLGQTAPSTELHLYADRSTPYAVLAEVMAAASTAGLQKIGFVSTPKT